MAAYVIHQQTLSTYVVEGKATLVGTYLEQAILDMTGRKSFPVESTLTWIPYAYNTLSLTLLVSSRFI